VICPVQRIAACRAGNLDLKPWSSFECQRQGVTYPVEMTRSFVTLRSHRDKKRFVWLDPQYRRDSGVLT